MQDFLPAKFHVPQANETIDLFWKRASAESPRLADGFNFRHSIGGCMATIIQAPLHPPVKTGNR
jgi:hypothetical protein